MAPGSKVVSAFRFLDLLGDVAAERSKRINGAMHNFSSPLPAVTRRQQPAAETHSNMLTWFPPGFHDFTVFSNFAIQPTGRETR